MHLMGFRAVPYIAQKLKVVQNKVLAAEKKMVGGKVNGLLKKLYEERAIYSDCLAVVLQQRLCATKPNVGHPMVTQAAAIDFAVAYKGDDEREDVNNLLREIMGE